MAYIEPLQPGNPEDLQQGQPAPATAPAPAANPLQQQPVDTAQKNFFQQAQDFVATEILGQDQDERDEARGRSREIEETIAQDDSILAEGAKAIAGAPKNLGTKVLGAAEFAGDVVGAVADAAGVIERDDSDIPWSNQYQYAQYDLGAAETQTIAGGMAQEMLSFILGGAITGGAASAAGAGQLASSGVAIASDFVLDYFSSDEGGNISNRIQESPLANHLSAALAHQEEDNSHIRRLKNAIENLIPGIGIEAIMAGYRGLRAGRAAIAAGATAEEGAATARQVANETPSGPAAAAAAEENATISGRPVSDVDPEGKPAMYEPQERAVQIDKADVNTSAASFWDDDMPGGGHSLVDEVDVQQIRSTEGLRQFVAERIPDVDVDDISRRLGRQTDEHIRDTFRSLAEFAIDGDIEGLGGRLSFNYDIDGGFQGQLPGGIVVLDTLSRSLGEKISNLSANFLELDALDASAIRQGEQLLDRAEVLVGVRKEASQIASKGLESFKDIPPQLHQAVVADRVDIRTRIDDIRSNLRSGDPAAIQKGKKELRQLGLAMVSTKGDPKAQMRVLEAAGRVARRQFSKVQVLSMLSQPLTHSKNLGGNFIRMGEQNFSRAIGGLFTDGVKPSDGAYALQGIHESIAAAGRVGVESFNSPVGITTAGSKMVDYVAQDRKVLENIVKTASNKGEKFAAQVYLNIFDGFNHPWFTWPGKALQVGDDFTKSLMAHMELRRTAGIEARDILKDFNISDPAKASALADKRYAALVDQKIKPNGQILDDALIDTVEAAAFQRQVTGPIGRLGRAIQGMPGGRLILPFYQTPGQIIRYSQELSPLEFISKEWKDTMRFGTQEQKAIMRGRMAMGSMSSAAVAALAANDLATGFGPPPGPERDLWLKNHQPHSFRIGDKWVSYQFIPGFSILWGMTADAVNMGKDLSDGDFAHLAGAIPYFFANAITAQPVFGAFNAINGLLDTRNWNGEEIVEQMAEIVNRALGSSGIRRQFVNAAAGGLHDFKNWSERFVAHATGGLTEAFGATPSYPRIDILTGEQMQGRYGGNPLNTFNPLTVVGPEKSELVETFRALEYPITDVVPVRVNGVKLNGEEYAYLQDLIHAEGQLSSDLKRLLKPENKGFWRGYAEWQKDYENGTAVPRKESEWYQRINRVVHRHVDRARRQLVAGKDPVSQNFLQTRESRVERPANQPQSPSAIQNLVRFAQ